MKKYLFTILIIIISSCSSSDEITKVEIPDELDENIAVSQSKNISVNIPVQWKNISDNSETVFDIWLVSPENNAAIGFIPQTINEDIDEEDKIKLLSKFNLESLKTKNAEINSNETFTLIEIDDFLANPLFYKIDGKSYNSIIFGKDKIYYKSLAYFGNNFNPTEDEIEELIELHELVISSAKFK
ncbi:MAG: hypothetical protein IPM32_06500 [Ignavibacteriae bacterium]|nr:hypothetical protein [Ignavibacteriota bacterium]